MKCFELRNDRLHIGLRIDEHEGKPRVNITEDSMMYMLLEPDLARFFLHRVAKVAPVNLTHARVSDDHQFLQMKSKNDHKALVLLNIRAGHGGRVTLTSRECKPTEINGQTEYLYESFPPPGIELIGHVREDDVWSEGTPHLELLIAMNEGAQFRVQWSGPYGKRELAWKWDGAWLGQPESFTSPKRQKKENETLRFEPQLEAVAS